MARRSQNLSGIGSFEINYVNPDDDPRKKEAKK
jgi:hypothetical protein